MGRYMGKYSRYMLWGIIFMVFIVIIIPLLTISFLEKNYTKVEIEKMGKTINVFDYQTNKLMTLDLEEYIVGVVAAEMPAVFDIEALKAQAVAARTYAYKRLLEPDPTIRQYHPLADVITNPAICQAWAGDDELKEKWGRLNYIKYKKKIVEAVEATKGQILLFEDKPIDPVYHASCGGLRTEDSGDVWKYSFPYLKSVPCSGHEDKHIRDTKTIPLRNIDVALGSDLEAIPAAKLQGAGINNYIKVVEKTKGGRIKTLNVNGKKFSGNEVRTKLGLKSTWFTWQIDNDKITFITRGYGHGVGMCQYGADGFAKQGKKYDDILKHYYQGVSIGKIPD
ncbi:MAG: stage II sporulation protein D [Clostridia bacterium]|nr:stage II sporulation protein D [Clostridia bacterium]